MIFKRNLEGEDILGLKVIGGQILAHGRQGAIIEKVKRGSIADQEGHIKPGKTYLQTKILFNFFLFVCTLTLIGISFFML